MSDSPAPNRPPPTVFLSYASEDREAAKSIRDALQAMGLEVWYDESGLDGGDAWDQKIRRQIRECDLFMPVVSAQTEARHEGYFRREWRLAVERTQDMADDHIYLLPVVIDSTDESVARVPEKFLSVQWTRMPGGKPTPAFEALCARLLAGQTVQVRQPSPSPSREVAQPPARKRGRGRGVPDEPPPPWPEFPKHDAGQNAHFYARVGAWSLHSLWVAFRRAPKLVRIIIYLWIFVTAWSWVGRISTPTRHAERLSSADVEKLKQISDQYQTSGGTPPDVAKLVESVTKNFPGKAGANAQSTGMPLLAIPFSAPTDDAAAKKIADSTFAQVFGRVSISHPGQVALVTDSLPSSEPSSAAEIGRKRHARYVLYGGVDPQTTPRVLSVKWVSVSDNDVTWSAMYPVTGADPARIAAEVDGKIPDLDDD